MVWLVSTGVHGPDAARGRSRRPTTRPSGGSAPPTRSDTPGADTPAVEFTMTSRPAFSVHGDVDVHGVGQGVRLGGVTQREHGWTGTRNGGGRRIRGGADQGGGHHEERGASNAVDASTERRDARYRSGRGTIATSVEASPGEMVHGGAIGVRAPPVHCCAVRVDQVIPSLASRDAIGVSTLNLRDGLRAAGIDSDIYYGSFTPDVEHEGRPVIELGRAGRDRWLLYQASIGSPVYDILSARSEPKLVNYHNITPASLLRDWEPAVAYEASLGANAAGPAGAAEPLRRGRLGVQRVRARRPGVFGHGRRAAAHRHAGEVATRPIRRWRRAWRRAGRVRAGLICCTWGRSRRTRHRTIW